MGKCACCRSSLLTITSSDRTFGSQGDFFWTLPSVINNIGCIKVLWILLPYTWNNLDVSNNSISITDSGSVTFVATVPPGIYDAVTLAEALQTQLVADSTDAFTVVFNTSDQTFTIADGTGDFSINSGALAKLMGFDVVLSGADTYTSTLPVDLTRSQYVSVVSRSLGRFSQNFTSGGVGQMITTIPVGQVCADSYYLFQPQHPTNLGWDCTQPLQGSIDLGLRFDDGSAVDLQGICWTIAFELEINCKICGCDK